MFDLDISRFSVQEIIFVLGCEDFACLSDTLKIALENRIYIAGHGNPAPVIVREGSDVVVKSPLSGARTMRINGGSAGLSCVYVCVRAVRRCVFSAANSFFFFFRVCTSWLAGSREPKLRTVNELSLPVRKVNFACP